MLPPLRVLLAEDHPLMRECIAGLLSAYGAVVSIVERADQVFHCVQRLHPDALVMDISMPGPSGLQVLPELRFAFPRLAIILLTSHNPEPYRQAAFDRGADGFVLKPRAARELCLSVQSAVTARRSLGSLVSASR